MEEEEEEQSAMTFCFNALRRKGRSDSYIIFILFLVLSTPSSPSSSSPQSCRSIAGKRSSQSCLRPRPFSFLPPKSILSPPIPLSSWLAAPPLSLLLPLSQDKTRETLGAGGGGGFE